MKKDEEFSAELNFMRTFAQLPAANWELCRDYGVYIGVILG